MINKRLAAALFFAAGFSTASAGSLYFSPGISYENIHANGSSYEGIVGALNVGYGWWMHNTWYLAGEIFGNTKPHTYHESNFGSLLKPGYSWGASIVPAMNVENAVTIYARLGYVHTNFQNIDQSASAYQAGLGLEAPLENCWSARVEYVYSPYHSLHDMGTVQFNQVTLALVYRFEPLLMGFVDDL